MSNVAYREMSSSSSSGSETETENSESPESVEPKGPKNATPEENYNNNNNTNKNNNNNNNNNKSKYIRKNISDDDDDDDDDNADDNIMIPMERPWNFRPMAYRSKSVGTGRVAAGGGQSVHLEEEEEEDEASEGYEDDTDEMADVVLVNDETADESIVNVDDDENETENDNTDNDNSDNYNSDNDINEINNTSHNTKTDSNETDNEIDNNETDNTETDNSETNNNETDNNETDINETDNENDNNETENNETDNQTENNETDNNETDNDETNNDSDNNNNENDDYNEYGEDSDYAEYGANEGYNATTDNRQAIDNTDNVDNDNTDDMNQDDEDVDVDVEVDDDDDAGHATMPYASESLAEYRPGGYHPVSVGDCFQQRYYAIKKIGWGHYSTVWLCYDTVLNRYSAIKFVKSAELYSYSARHEIKLLKRLDGHNNHPLRRRVVHLSDNFTTSGVNGIHQCLVFDVLGDNMLMLIQRSGYRGLPLYNVKQIALQVLQGLLFLHLAGKMIHTDLKPENVLLVTDDLPLRIMANRASKKFLDEVEEDESYFRNYHRTIKRKCPASISFFQSHRKWLRNRGIDDLRVLAKHGLLTKQMAIDAVEGCLPYMPFEGPVILTDSDLCQYNQSLMTEQVGDAAAEEAKIMPSRGTPAAGTGEPPQSQSLNVAGQKRSSPAGVKKERKALKKLNTDLEKFMNYVAKRVRKDEEAENAEYGPYYSVHKRSKLKKPMKSSHRHKQQQHHLSSSSRSQNNRNDANNRPNYKLIANKDPAVEPCKLQIVIADVGNACSISNHITEDIQTREYRAVEVILGAGYDTPADVWSAACLIWEMATGEYLFEPSKWRGAASPDEVHIASIIETCGPIDPNLIDCGRYSDEIFDENQQLHNIKKLNSRSMRKTLIEKFNWPRKEAKEFANFLKPMLITNPDLRISAFQALMHPWLHVNHETQK